MGLLRVAISVLVLISATSVAESYELKTGGGAAGTSTGFIAPKNWVSSFIAIWEMECPSYTVAQQSDAGFNAGVTCTATNIANNTSTSCGSDCDLYSSTVAVRNRADLQISDPTFAQLTSPDGSLNATNLQCDADNDDSDSLDNCTDLNITSGNISWGGWVNLDTDITHEGTAGPSDSGIQLMGSYDGGSDDNGWGLFYYWNGADYLTRYLCTLDGSQVEATASTTGISADVTGDTGWWNAWRYVVCTYDASTDVIKVYYVWGDYSESVSSVTSPTSSGENFIIGTTQSDEVQHYKLDSLFVAGITLTDADICRMCSCGIDGSNCSCSPSDATSYLSSGRNSSYCGSCTLPDCNSAIAGS